MTPPARAVGVKAAKAATDIDAMDRPLAPPVADSRLSRALSASACGTLLLVVPVRLDEMAALLGAALRETVLQAAARQLETALHTLQQLATGAEALHRRGDGFPWCWATPRLIMSTPRRACCWMRWSSRWRSPASASARAACAGRVDFDAQSGHEVATLLRQADLASPRPAGSVAASASGMRPPPRWSATCRLRAEDTLHRGINQIRLDLLFRDPCSTCAPALTGAVALHAGPRRWARAFADGGRGWAAVAADAGLMHRLTLMLLHGICRQVRQWRDQGLDVPSLSVDLPAGLWQDRALVSMVLDALVDQAPARRHADVADAWRGAVGRRGPAARHAALAARHRRAGRAGAAWRCWPGLAGHARAPAA